MASEKIVDIFCAQPISGEEITKVTIRIHEPLPELQTDGSKFWEKEHRDRYTEEAEALADALCHSLPGGTIDALLVKLLDAKRSLFAVPLYVKLKREEGEAPDAD